MGSCVCKCDEQLSRGDKDRPVEMVFNQSFGSMAVEAEEDVRLTIAIAGAYGLRENAHLAGRTPRNHEGCRCTVQVPLRRYSARFRTPSASDAMAPVPIWRSEIPIQDYIDGAPLHFTVTDDGGIGDVLGRGKLEASTFADHGFNGEIALAGGKSENGFLRVKVRNGGQDYPPGPPPKFTAEIEKKAVDDSLGLELDIQDAAFAYVLAVSEGPCSTYNESAVADRQISAGDFIERVNDARGDTAAMLGAMRSARELRVGIRRPEEFAVVLLRTPRSQPLGLTFPPKLLGRTLPIMEVDGGAVKDWNAAHPEFVVKAGDRITMVNGLPGEAADFHKTIEASEKILLTVVRPATSGDQGSWMYW